MAEEKEGWLEGPMRPEEVTASLKDEACIASPRFPPVQSDKIRCVDDFSMPLVNMAFASPERMMLGEVDEVAAKQASPNIEVYLATGEGLQGYWHKIYRVPRHRQLLGRTLDLLAEYRQLAVAPESK